MTHRLLIVDEGAGLWGAQRCLLRLAPFLKEADYELDLLSPKGSDLARVWPESVGGRVITLPEGRGQSGPRDGQLNRLRLIPRIAANALRVARASRIVNADAVLANSSISHLYVAAATKLTGVPSILYLHEEMPSKISALAHRVAVRCAQDTIAVSRDVALSVGRSSNIRIIPNGVDVTVFSPGPCIPSLRSALSRHPSCPLVVAICRIDAPKQVDHVIRAVSSLNTDEASPTLAVIGSTTTSVEYQEDIHQLGQRLLGDRIVFSDSREDIPDVLRCADAYVLASRFEGMPLGILEAQASGCPVVAYPSAGVRDEIEDGVTGIFAEMNNWNSLATSLAIVLGDEVTRDRITTNALSKVRTSLTLAAQGEAVTSRVKSLMARRDDATLKVRHLPGTRVFLALCNELLK